MNKFESKDNKLYINGKVVLKGWESFTGWYWFATEIEKETYNDLPVYFGFVQGFEEEWGNFTESELNDLIKLNQVWEIPQKSLSISGRRFK